MEQVSENIFVETSFRGCNPGIVVVPEGVVMIDTPYRPKDALAWREFVLSKGTPLYLIHTEAHIDHVLGDHFFPEPVLVCHEDVPARLPTTPQLFQPFKDSLVREPDALPPMECYWLRPHHITFSSSMKLHLGDRTLELINLPGHTAQETAVIVRNERVAFTGDNIFHKCQAYIQEGSPRQWLESLAKIAELDVDVLVPGHGSVCSRDYVPEMTRFIQDWVDAVQAAVDRGLNLEETMAAVSPLNRYPVELNNAHLEPVIHRLNVTNIYNRIVNGRL